MSAKFARVALLAEEAEYVSHVYHMQVDSPVCHDTLKACPCLTESLPHRQNLCPQNKGKINALECRRRLWDNSHIQPQFNSQFHILTVGDTR
jgi:hypothetical protein